MRWMLLVAVLGGCASAQAAGEAEGKQTYDKYCASCHGADGRGNPTKAKAIRVPPESLNLGRPETAHLSRDELRVLILEGKEKMPGYKRKLQAAQVEPLLDYTMSLAHKIRTERERP